MKLILLLFSLLSLQGLALAQANAGHDLQEMQRLHHDPNASIEMKANGFEVASEHTFLEYQFFLVFKVK